MIYFFICYCVRIALDRCKVIYILVLKCLTYRFCNVTLVLTGPNCSQVPLHCKEYHRYWRLLRQCSTQERLKLYKRKMLSFAFQENWNSRYELQIISPTCIWHKFFPNGQHLYNTGYVDSIRTNNPIIRSFVPIEMSMYRGWDRIHLFLKLVWFTITSTKRKLKTTVKMEDIKMRANFITSSGLI